MKDSFGRTINYLRISVTDRCNLRCRYCMPPGRIDFLAPDQLLSFDEIVEVATVAASLGVTKVRVTGGEPLMRKDIAVLVGRLSQIDGIADLAMTTNGTQLAAHAQSLADAGLARINVSLDSIDPQRYRELSCGGDLSSVLAGIEAARAAGLCPIKLNCVMDGPTSDLDADRVRQFAQREGLEVRFIHRIDLNGGSFSVVEGGSGGDCQRCNRLRLSCDGRIWPCLLTDAYFPVRQLGAAAAIRQAVSEKPQAGTTCSHDWMYAIGG